MTMRKLCILCCVVLICILVSFSVYADIISPTPIIGPLIENHLRAFWGAIVAAALAVAAFISQIFHKK